MNPLQRFFRLSAREEYAVCAAALVLAGAKLLLHENHFDSVRRRARALARLLRVTGTPDDLIAAIERARNHLPWRVTCLHEAIAAEALLKANGHECTLCIGARAAGGAPEFHAWLSAGNRVLIGDSAQPYALLYCAR